MITSSRFRLASTKISFPKLTNVQEIVPDQQFNWKVLFEKQEPILFKGIHKNWKACNSWSDSDYLKAKVTSSSNQEIIVPVEFGDSYMDEELQILHLDFIELLDFFDKKDITNIPTLYLAQVL